MLDEDQINKKILEAADAYQPDYEDEAWKEMERLLDAHLPQRKDKRRIIFLILLFLISATGIYFGAQYKNNRYMQVLNIKPANQPGLIANDASTNPAVFNKNKKATTNAQANGIYTTSLYNRKQNLSPKLSFAKTGDNKSTGSMVTNVQHKRSYDRIENASLTSPLEENILSAISIITNAPTPVSGKERAEINKGADNTNTLIKNRNKKNNNKKISNYHFAQNFSLGIAGGFDVSAVKLNKTGKMTLIKGLQIGYRLSEKFTLRSGFLIAKKIYNANGSQYHYNTYNPANHYLQTVDADCQVYEIPLTVSYNFSKSRKHEGFVSAGLSSYFMRKESYEYFYKYPSGYTDTKYYSVSSKNKHYFSVLNLSAGYEYTINKRVSLTAEPYIKVPFTGIGIGKIKLNSAGILFSLNIKPF